MKKCIICKSEFRGRQDKKFCSAKCKSYYHHKLRTVTNSATKETDNILHRNRSILLEILGKTKGKVFVEKIDLEKKNFRFNFVTGFYKNSKNKLVHHVYDFSWMEFSDQGVVIFRKLSNR